MDGSNQSRQARDLATARRVMAIEAAGIEAAAAALDGRFSAAVDRLLAVKGRVVVTGIGKSGQIARKIAATLASTGTPALYVHPAEASHGDLGMITPADAILALSFSGETTELSDIVAYAGRFRIPIVALTGQAASALGQAADVALVLPSLIEACPMGLAPTTSTAAMLAVGDALALALLDRRGFTPDEFRDLHPGGRLGRVLRRVEHLMHGPGELPLAQPDTPMAEAILVMSAKGFGCVGIVDAAGRLAGIVTDGDLRRHMGPGLLRLSSAEVMTPMPQTIEPSALAGEALRRMNEHRITSLFAVADGRPVGLIHIHDCLRAGVM